MLQYGEWTEEWWWGDIETYERCNGLDIEGEGVNKGSSGWVKKKGQ